jgi:hypothetical protein
VCVCVCVCVCAQARVIEGLQAQLAAAQQEGSSAGQALANHVASLQSENQRLSEALAQAVAACQTTEESLRHCQAESQAQVASMEAKVAPVRSRAHLGERPALTAPWCCAGGGGVWDATQVLELEARAQAGEATANEAQAAELVALRQSLAQTEADLNEERASHQMKIKACSCWSRVEAVQPVPG